jgi:hypothetical protein
VQCNSGCVQVWTPNGDGTYNGTYSLGAVCDMNDTSDDQCKNMVGDGYHYNSYLSVCEPDATECPTGQKKDANGACVSESCPSGMVMQQDGTCENEKNECPAGQIKSPAGSCLPGEGQCAEGEALGKDGTCKRDSDGDGTPDEDADDPENKNFSGGDDCNSPPSCSGDVIMCGQARIQWRIDCNTRKNRNINGGTCDVPPVCTGEKCDALEYSALLMQWRSACAAEKLLAKSGTGNDDGDGDEQPAWTKVDGMSQDPGAGVGEGDAPTVTTNQMDTSDLDESGFGSGSCMGFASGGGGSGISSGFAATLASPPAFFCNYINYIYGVMVLVGAVASVIILTGGRGG